MPDFLFRFLYPGTRIAHLRIEEIRMETFVIGGTLVGSLVGAFVIERMALEGLFRILRAGRRTRG